MKDREFIFEMPSEEELVRYISIKGEKGDTGDVSKQQLDDTKKELENTITEVTKAEQITEIAEALTITDCAGVNGSLDIKEGKTIQEGTPTLTTLIDIRNVGDNINLYDGEDLKVAQGNSSFRLSLNKNTSYNISFKKSRINGITISNEQVYDIQVIRFYNSNGDLLSEITGTLYKLSSGSTIEISIPFTTPSDTSYATFQLGNNNGDNNINTLVSEIKIEKGTIATSYSKYNCGSVGFKVQNKNICDNSKVTSIDIRGNGTYRMGIDLGVLSVGTYYVSRKDKNKTAVLYLTQVINGEYQDYETYGFEFAFTITEPCRCIIRSTDNLLDAWNRGVGELQIEKGEKTSYVEHQEQTVIFPFTKGQVLHKGDYLSEDGIHQVRKTIILNGTEELELWGNGTSSSYRLVYKNLANIIKKNGLILSNYYTAKLAIELYEFVVGITIDTNGYIIIHDSRFKTLEEWKSYLAEQYTNGTPVTIEYELAEETITPYTEEQKEAYYQLQHLLMYEGYTSIECIEDIKPDIQVTYSYNNEINKIFGKKIDELSSEVHELKKQVADLTAMVLSI